MMKAVTIKGVKHAKKWEHWTWGFDDHTEKFIEAVSASAGNIILDTIVENIKRNDGILFSWLELTYWPLGLDWPQVDFSIKKLMDEEIAQMTDRPNEYDPDDIQAVADDLRKYANKYEAAAKLALKNKP